MCVGETGTMPDSGEVNLEYDRKVLEFRRWYRTLKRHDLRAGKEYLDSADIENPKDIQDRCLQIRYAAALGDTDYAEQYLPILRKHICWLILNDSEHPILAEFDCYRVYPKFEQLSVDTNWMKYLEGDRSRISQFHAALTLQFTFPKLAQGMMRDISNLPLTCQQDWEHACTLAGILQRQKPPTNKGSSLSIAHGNTVTNTESARQREIGFLLVFFQFTVLMTLFYFTILKTAPPKGIEHATLLTVVISYLLTIEYVLRVWHKSLLTLLPPSFLYPEPFRRFLISVTLVFVCIWLGTILLDL